MPVLLKKSLTTPLVLWCDDSPSSELGIVFSSVALSESTYGEGPSYAWINRYSTCSAQPLEDKNKAPTELILPFYMITHGSKFKPPLDHVCVGVCT